MPTMILAAGLGTRLMPLTAELPKPLVPVGDRAAILHVLAAARAANLGPTVVNTHHFADALAHALGPHGVTISHETELLGTAGGVAAAAPWLGAGDVLVWNADILADLDLTALFAAHARAEADATLVVTEPERAHPPGHGNVGLTADARVVRLRGETFAPGEVRGADFVGIHVLGAVLRADLPRTGCLVGDVYLPRGHAGARYRAFVHRGDFVDIGSLATYAAANFAWLARRGRGPYVAGTIAPEVVLGDSVVVGEGAEVQGAGPVDRVVVWPGARAVAPLSDAIVTPRGVVPLGPLDPRDQSPTA